VGVENGRRHVRRQISPFAAVALLATVLLAAQPHTPAAASSPSCVVPYLEVGSSTLVAGVTTVTATVNSAEKTSTYPGVTDLVEDGQYYFSTPNRIRLVLTFSPAVNQVRVEPDYNADSTIEGGEDAYEEFTFKAFDDTTGGTQVGGTKTAKNSDDAETLGDGATDTIFRLEVDYTSDLLVESKAHDDAAHVTTPRASLLNVLIPGTCEPTLAPSTQSITGVVGEALASTAQLSAAGFTDVVTYAVTAGALPAGLTLNTTTGVVSGTPTASGTSNVTITGTGATAETATVTISFDVSDPAPLPVARPPSLAVAAPSLALDCTPDPVASGAVVTCVVSDGQPDIDILWNAIAAGTVFEGRGIALDGSGSGSFTFLAPRGADAVDVDLVAWGVSDTVRIVGGLVPTAVPAGEGPRDGMPPAVALIAVAAALVLRGYRHPGRGGLRWGHGR